MNMRKSRILNYLKYSVFLGLVIVVFVMFPISMLNSKSYNLFAELVVSENTAILADNSFSQSTFNGYKAFLESKNVNLPNAASIQQNLGVWRRPGTTTLERETTFKGLFASGKDMIIAPGFNHQTAIQNVAIDPQLQNKGFLLLDSDVSYDETNNQDLGYSNLSSFTFRADQAAFLAGIAAGQFLNDNKDIFGKDGSLRVGGFVGLPIPTTLDFLAGFQSGIFAYNELIKGKADKQQIEWISLGTERSDYASGNFAVGNGIQKAKDLINYGADMIMPIAGPQATDVVSEIIRQQKTVTVIGVDSAQELQTINKPLPTTQKLNKSYQVDGQDMIIQFSAIKKLDKATQSVLEAIFNTSDPNNEKDDQGNKIKGFGFHNTGTLENETVGISDEGLKYIKEADPTFVTNGTDGIEKISWEKIKENQFFKDMTNNASFYWKRAGETFKDKSSATEVQGFFNKLQDGVAQAKKITKKNPLNGSNWKVEI